MLSVVCEQRRSQLEHRPHPLVRDPVIDGATVTAGRDETAPAQARKMVRDLRLRQSKPANELTDAQLTFAAKQFEDPQPDRVTQPAEVLRDQIARQRHRGKPERGRAKRSTHAGSYIRMF